MTQSVKDLWSIFLPAERRKVLGMLLLVVMMAGFEALGVISIMPFLSVLGRPDFINENTVLQSVYEYWEFDSSRQFTIALGFFSIVLVVSSSLLKTTTQHLLNRFVHFQRHSISARLMSCYLQQPYEFFLTRNPSELSKNVLSEVDQLMFDVVQPMSNLVAQGAVVLAMSLLIFFHDPVMAFCILSALGLLYGSIYGLVRRRLAHIGLERREANGQRYQACGEVFGGIKDVKVNHSADIYQEKFNRASSLFSRHSATNETFNQSPLYLVETVGYTGLIVIALFLLIRSNDIAHVLPSLGLYGFAAYRMLPAAQVIYRGIARLRFSSSSLAAIKQDLSLPKVPRGDVGVLEPLAKEIRLQGVTYAYPLAENGPVLKDYNLTIVANNTVGIMGRSGSGKTTVMDILLGLLSPQEGSLSVDGVLIDSGNVAIWQRCIGYVPQQVYLVDASIKENIAFGVLPSEIDMQLVEHAARMAQIHDFVEENLLDGYDTKVGDRGVRLSGGQRQRIGIARALYRNPSVLFLDEATSALDSKTEREVMDVIRSLEGEKTVIVISHDERLFENFKSVARVSS